MGIGAQRQAEVTHVVGAVHGLLHGAQQHGVDELRIGPVLDLIREFGEVRRIRLQPALQLQSQLGKELAEDLQFELARPLVNTVQGMRLAFLDIARRGHVGLDHALFDDLVGIVAHQRHYALDFALGVEDVV